MAAITLDELLKETEICTEKLNQRVSDEHLRAIAIFLTSWRRVAVYLDLSVNDLDDVERNRKDEQDKRLNALQIWKGKFGFKATYTKLVEALLFLSMTDIAEKICHLLKVDSPVNVSATSSSQELQSAMRHECSNVNTANGVNTGLTDVLSKRPSFKQLSSCEQEELMAKLYDDEESMKFKFSNLVTETCKSVEKETTVQMFAGNILALGAYDPAPEERDRSLLDEHRKEIKSAETISDIFIILSAYWNYLSYEILKHIIERFGTSDDKKSLGNYNEDLQNFCKRRIFELLENGGNTDDMQNPKQAKFVVKLNVREDISYKEVLQIRRRVAKILCVNLAAFIISHVDVGCVQLTFLIPKFVAQEIFPLPDEQTSALSKDASVIRLECGNYIFEDTTEISTGGRSTMSSEVEGPEDNGLHHLRLLQPSKTKADQQLRLKEEGDEPHTASYSPAPSTGKNAQQDTSISSICLSTAHTVRNGLQLKLDQDIPFASYTYALSPLTDKLAPVEWKLLVTEDVECHNIRCHELHTGDNLPLLIAGFQKAHAVAIVLINTSDNYNLQPLFLTESQVGHFPVLLLTKSDGMALMKQVEKHKGKVLAQITVETPEWLGKEPIHTSSDMIIFKEPGIFQSIKQFVTRERYRFVDLTASLEKVMFTGGDPIIVSEDSVTFACVMFIFNEYEKYAKPGSSHTDVNEALKKINCHLVQTFPRDFPFYLVLASKMHKKLRVYKCNENEVFIRSCIERMENMSSQQVASIFLGFLQRCDFKVDREEPSSVFQLLQKACIQMAQISYNLWEKQAQPFQHHLHQGFVYSRFMWVSLQLRLNVECGIITENTANIWHEEVIKIVAPLQIDRKTVAEVKKGLDFGQQLNLPSNQALSPLLLANLFASEGCLRLFQDLSMLESYFSQQNDFIAFVTQIRSGYEIWLKDAVHNKYKAVSMTGTLVGTLQEGLTFVDTLYKFWTEHYFNPHMLDFECKTWILLLVQLVDVTGDDPCTYLKMFLSKSTQSVVVKKYKDEIIRCIIDQAYTKFSQLTIKQFLPLFKSFVIWPEKFLDDYLRQYKVPSGVTVSDGTWKKLFSEVVKRFSGAHHHHYLLDLLQSVAERYHQDGRAGDLLVDLLKLEVPKLFAVEEGEEKDEEVRHKFSEFLRNYIFWCNLKHTTLKKMGHILAAISHQQDDFQLLVLAVVQRAVVQREVISGFKALQVEKFSPLYSVLNLTVTPLCKDLSWLQSPTKEQSFCWGIVASFCQSFPITNKHFEWVHSYAPVITCLGSIYISYCKWKKLPEDKCLLSADEYPQEIVHSEHIKKYFDFVHRVQAVLLEWKQKFVQEQINYDEILTYTSRQSQLKRLAQTFCASSAIVDSQDTLAVRNLFLVAYEQLNVLLIKYIPGHPDAKWCTLPSLLQHWSVALPPHLVDLISQHVVFPREKAVELLDNQPSPNTTGVFQPNSEISLKLTKALSLHKLSELVKEMEVFLKPIMNVLEMLVFFTLHRCEMFEKYLQVYLKKIETGVREKHSPTTVLATSICTKPWSEDQSVEGNLPLHVLQKAVVQTYDLIMKLMQGNATYSEIVAEGELNLENLNIEQEFSTLHSFTAYLKLSLSSDVGLAGVQSILELFQYVHYIRIIHSVCEQYQLQGCLEDGNLFELCQLVKDLDLKKNCRGMKLTLNEVCQQIDRVKKILCLGEERSFYCLELFNAVRDSAAFYQFVREKQFVGEKGQAAFRQQYQLITAQLQHEEYSETVLNHLYAAFKFIQLFMDTHQSFHQLMLQVTSLDVTNGIKQLQTVNSNITLIQLWFSRAEGDTIVNVATELDCIIATGNYLFLTPENGSEAELILEYNPSHQFFPPSSFQPPSLKDSEAVVSMQCWNSEQIGDFVRKLGFLDTEKEGGDEIKHFLHVNETAHKLLDLSVCLRELGYRQHIKSLNCATTREEADQQVYKTKMLLTRWEQQMTELRNQYKWLLFFSIPKLLVLYHLLQEENPNLETIVHEISFLCSNTQEVWESALKMVKEFLDSCHKNTQSDKAPMHVVGEFLEVVFNNQSLLKRCFSQPCCVSQLLHYCPGYSQAQLIRLVVSIYGGVPETFEVFRCHPSSTKEELSLFLKRMVKHRLQYLILEVNRLPFILQEYLMQLHSVIQEREVEMSFKAPCLHLVETTPSILRKMPWVVLREHMESGPSLNFEEAHKICLLQVVKDLACVQLVYGRAGDGKTHYIQQQLAYSPASLTIAVNEAFTPLKAISKLRTLPLNQKNCAIFFNFTMLPPGESVDESERIHHQQLMEVIGWFFFDLLMLGYVEDYDTGQSFCIPGGRAWAIYVEVPSRDLNTIPEEALKHFQQEVPALGLLGTPHYIDPDTPYTVDEEVQLVCKYLKALQIGGKKGIDRLYKGFRVQPVKFSSQPDLKKEECQKLLLQYMPEHVQNTKITQRLFIKYMNRRCSFLDSLPGFNFNMGLGEYFGSWEKRVCTDTRQLGSTLMTTMIREVEDFCDPDIKENWSLKPHQQLIYDFKNGGASLGLISLHPENLSEEDKMKFKAIGIEIPSMSELYSRELLDVYLSRALNVDLEDGRLTPIDDSAYVLTLDFTIKMLNIHERYKCGVPVIIEGETGVGKTALLEMLSKLWNHALVLEWKRQYRDLLDFMRLKLEDISTDVSDKYQACVQTVEALIADQPITEEDLVLLGRLPDPIHGHLQFYSVLRSFLLSMRSNPVVTLLILQEFQQQVSLEELFERAEKEDSAESTARLLYRILTTQIKPTFHKLNVHAAMTPADIWNHLQPVFIHTRKLCGAFENVVADTSTLRAPFVTVFLDEVNTSSCLGLFKEIIVDRSFDGNPIPDNVFIVAACNPHRGNSLASHCQKETWVRGAYYVRQLHPTLRFLMWDYGSLDKNQERNYIYAKMKMLNRQMPNAEVASLTDLIVASQNLMRDYAFRQLCSCGLDKHQAKLSSRSCVSQRDIQRVFAFYQWVMDSYTKYKPYGEQQDYSRRAVLVALGIVYYMRLDSQYRKEYEEYLDKQVRVPNVSFSQAFNNEVDWYMHQVELPTGIARTRALKENLFATIVCTVTHTPLIIVGAPGSSKTLSFNLAIANLKGQESKMKYFRDTTVFRSLDPHFYQCSRQTTSNEIQTVFSRAINRQRSHSKSKLPIYCVVFMDEAGLPEESHESLKVLHYYLDTQEVSFVAITNHILDAAKTNRAVSLFRPEASDEDLETLAKGCLCNIPDKPPPEIQKDLKTVVQFCPAFSHLMKKSEFRLHFGLRDFIHFVSYLRRQRTHNRLLEPQLVMEALERNFNGSDNFNEICNTFLKMMKSSMDRVLCRSILEVLKDSLKDCFLQQGKDMAEAEVRYKLIVDPSEDDSLVRLLFSFGVLQRKKTHIFMCSDFPGNTQLQKVNTIAAIRHSVIEGHTVVMTQTDDIHQSFYDLFNQRFRKIDVPGERSRYYTNIAIGAHTKPSRVDPNFQCVVVIKKSEVENTPPPFLNRFEKYCITHHSLLEVALSYLSPYIRIIVEAAMKRVQDFIDHISGPSSLYGLKGETLDSLVLSLIPQLTHTYESLEEPQVTDSSVESTKDPSIVEESPKEPSVMEEPPKELSVMDGGLDPKVLLMTELLQNLRNCIGFNIPPYFLEELHLDTNCLFDLVLGDQQFEGLLPSLSHFTATQAVAEAMRVLHSAAVPQDGAAQLSTEGCLVVTLFQQWLVRHLCKQLMQLMTSEAFILYRNTLPSSYLENYISFQGHFSLKELILKYHRALEHSGWNPACSPTKLLCFTRSSPLIHQLPAQYPSPVLDTQASSTFQCTLRDLVFPYPSKLVVCTLSSLLSQSSMQEMLKTFVLSDKSQVCLLVVNMQETSRQVVNHLRIMIEEAELLSTQRAKLFVMLLHFPPAQFFSHCYPSLFLKGWDHCYLDTVARSADKGVIDIQDWLWRCCFPKEAPENDFLVLALQDILPEAIPVLYSRVFFGSNKQGSFNKPMNGSQRTKALEELLFKKGVGQILCEKFCSYWKPAVMTEYLERAAMFTRDHESTLNIADSIQIVFKGLFFDFLVYMLSQMNDGCNVDVLYDSDFKDSESKRSDNKSLGNKDSDSKDSDITPVVQELFLDVLQTFSLPKLSQLQFLSTSLPATTSDHSPKFPFFKMVCEAVERIVKQSHDKTNVPLDLVQKEETEPMDSFHIHDDYDICNVLQEVVKKRIKEKMEATPKESLVLALKAMKQHPTLWQYYLDDFLLYKLRLGDLHRGAISQQVLCVLFQQLRKQDAISRVVSLHCYTHIHHDRLANLIANLLPPLNQIQQTTTIESHLLAPTDPEGEALAKATQTQNLLGTPEHIATLVVNTLFAAIVEVSNASVATVPEKMRVWFMAYRDLMTLSAVKKSVYEPLGSETGGLWMVVEAKLNVMQAVFLAIQTSPSLGEEILQKGLHIFQTLLNEYFTTTLKLIGYRPNLEEMVSVTLKIISETTTFSSVRSVRFLVEGLFAHFFASYRHSYHTEDIQWFLELANKQEKWRANPLEHSQHHQPVTETETNTTLQIPQGAVSLYVFKLYLGRILGPCDQCVHKVALSAPLQLHFKEQRSQVGMVLMATANLGCPAPYIPTFYQRCSSITPRANHEIQRMQQPLAHLYFLTLMEHLQAQRHTLSGLLRIANAITEQFASPTSEVVKSVVLWIELQAVVQLILQKLAVHLNPSKLRMGEVYLVVDDINRLLDDVETGGGDTNGHGMVLVMHLMKQLNSSQKLSELLTRKYDSICSWLHCLKPFHEQFTHSQQLDKLFTDIRYLGLCYPYFPTEQDFIRSTENTCSYTQKGELYLLRHFAQEWPRFQTGGLLLPDLVEFYQWLHTALAHQVTKEHARTLSIGCVVELAMQRYSKEEGEHIQALYNRVKGGYNQYVTLSGGRGACSALKIYNISDKTPLFHFLSDEADKEESNDRLCIMAADIIAVHNTFIEAVYSAVQAQHLSRFLPDEPPRVYPSEVNESSCIVGKLRSVHGISDFLQFIRSRYQPSSDAPMELQTVQVPFQLSLLQEDIVAYFLAGKPLIYIEPSSPLRIPFKFLQPTNSVEETDVVGPALNVDNIIENLPDTFQAPLEESYRKQLEYEFHSASYHTMVEVVTGLRIVTGHLVKAVKEQSSGGLEDKTVPEFMLMLYDHLEEKSAVLKEIGVCSTSYSQLVCLIKLPLSSLFSCLQLLTSWVKDGVYDFAALPFGLKSCLSSQDLQSIEQIPLKWTGTLGHLLTEIKQMNEVLKHSEARITKTANESANKPLMQYLQEIQHLRMEDRLPIYMPPSILIQHYVYFRIALRRLTLTVQQQVKAGADNGNTEKEQWREGVNDLWENKLSHLREEIIGAFVYDPQTGRYGFQEGSEYDSEDELMDDLMNEVEGENHAPKGNGEDPDHHVTSVGSHSLSYNQDFYNDGAFVYDPQTGRYGFQEGLDYDSEEELTNDLVNKEEDRLSKGDAEESFVVISEGQVPSVEFNRREKEEGTGGPKESDEGLAQIYKDPEFRKKIRSMAREYRDTQTLEQSAQDCTPEHVGQFLEGIGLGHHVAKFIEQDVSGDMLLDPDQEMLEELGVSSAIERLKIKVLFQRSLQGGEAQYPLESVLDFLEQNKLSKYSAIFQESGIDGDLLLEADDNVLKELGVSSAVDRKKFKTKYKTFVKS